MGLYRSFRPLVVDARQCTSAEAIATDLGFANVSSGDWIISTLRAQRRRALRTPSGPKWHLPIHIHINRPTIGARQSYKAKHIL